MIRTTALWLFVFLIGVYAWKDWYRSLCALILMMAVIEHPDMPKTMLGIQGLNPWNLLLLVIICAWAVSRRAEKLEWDMPAGVSAMLLLYLGVIVVGVVRMFADTAELTNTTAELVSETLVNTIKWVIPGLLLFDGCRSRERFVLGVASIVGVYFLLGVQVIKWMPFDSVMSGDSLAARSLKILVKEVGFHRVNLSAMFAGGGWAMLAARPLAQSPAARMAIVFMSLSVMFAQALTGGRAGYATWGCVGLVLGVLYWRKLLLMVPVGIVAMAMIVPGARQRMLEGFTPETHDRNVALETSTTVDAGFEEDQVDEYTVTAGRSVIWPYVLGKIGESPVFGYGRLAMQRTGLARQMQEEVGESFPHPHNAYLEMLLDNGIIGFLIVIPFYFFLLVSAISLFRDDRSQVFQVAGGITCSLILAMLIASMGSQTFYPREGWVGMWCAFGLMLRVKCERERLRAPAPSAERPPSRFARVPPVFAPKPIPRMRPISGIAVRPAALSPSAPAQAGFRRAPAATQPVASASETLDSRLWSAAR